MTYLFGAPKSIVEYLRGKRMLNDLVKDIDKASAKIRWVQN